MIVYVVFVVIVVVVVDVVVCDKAGVVPTTFAQPLVTTICLHFFLQTLRYFSSYSWLL